jgi:hypothetical protein
MTTIAQQIALFKDDLGRLESREIVQRYITFGETAKLDPAQHFVLRSRIAAEFNIHPLEVVVVGSAKLGFSIKPTRRYGEFGDSSDVDVALVSNELFRRFWRDMQEYVDGVGFWPKRRDFERIFFHGWIRPDLMPPSESHPQTRAWWEFFRGLTASRECGQYKIAAGIYFDWHCLERYQTRGVKACKEESSIQ